MEHQALGKRIREERLKLNLTQEKLAEDVNLSTAWGCRLTIFFLIPWFRGMMGSTAYGANS